MTTITGTPRGDVCPPWCGDADHQEVRTRVDGPRIHPDDAGAYHNSPVVDRWQPMDGDRPDRDFIEVSVEGFRHDDGEDWADQIRATNVAPGFLSEVCLQVSDARRLGEALILAANLAEGKR